MRDPAVIAVHALHLTPAELDRVRAGLPVHRPFWPPVCCRDSVVGLSAGGEVAGEARLASATCSAQGVAWSFGLVTSYRSPLPHRPGRGMSSSMPEAPMGTLTPARDWDRFE